MSEQRVGNAEVRPGGEINLLELPSGSFSYHTNHYVRTNISQYIGNSSYERYQRIGQMTALPAFEFDAASIAVVLSDTTNEQWPIFRRGIAPGQLSAPC